MSQTVLITKKENIKDDDFYACIYTEESTVQNLLDDWCYYNPETGTWFGPLKMKIRDYDFIDKFFEDFKKINAFCPAIKSFDDIWQIYDENDNLIHLSFPQEGKFSKIFNVLFGKEFEDN